MERNSTSSAASSTLQIVVVQFKPLQKNTLQGFAVLQLPQVGLELHECPFHRDANGNAWVGFPARSYEHQGQKKWCRLVETTSKEWHYRFQHAAVRAVQDFLAKEQAQATSVPKARIPR